ncbi:MAG TPA: hypothetical protein VJ695_06945 [Nitrososphaera sp.]|nr:hypothetical protein [Nitrososphaera sp.]
MAFSNLTTLFAVLSLTSANAYGQRGHHNLPPSNIGGREVFLSFNAPSFVNPSEEIDMSYTFMDKATGNNVDHVTYFLGISDPQGNNTFSEVLHGHDGTVRLQFKPGEGQYRVNANYDNLAASYVADPAGLITVTGPVFAEPGTYTVDIEVNGIDYDNTFLPEPIKYQYSLMVASAQEFPVSHEGTTFNVNVTSSISIQNVTMKPENDQLVIQYPSGEWQHLDNFQVYVDIPKQMMMSEPFTAAFNGIQMNITHVPQSDTRITSLLLSGSHLDLLQMMNQTSGGHSSSMQGMEGINMTQFTTDAESQRNAIIITAAVTPSNQGLQ